MILSVRVIPRSSASAITGWRGDALLVRLQAPPVDGAANAALLELLARTFGRPRRDISLVSGETSRDKRVAIEGLSEADVAARLPQLTGHPQTTRRPRKTHRQTEYRSNADSTAAGERPPGRRNARR